MKTMITVLLVDDEPTVRQGLRMRLELEPDLAVIGEASTGLAALDLVQALQPDVVVMDIALPHMDGLVAAKGLQAMTPPFPVVVLSIHDDARTQGRAKAAGAAAFVSKQEGVERLLEAIRRAGGRPDVNRQSQ